MTQQSSPDRGTELESLEALRATYGDAMFSQSSNRGGDQPGRRTAAEPLRAAESEQAYRPALRPMTPRLTILDDGESLNGETVRLREPVTVIGRSDGDVRIPHDSLVSKRHAEVVREGSGPQCHWLLRDLGSANHTFVSCSVSLLLPDRILILGSRRFRFRPPTAGAAESRAGVEGTSLADLPHDVASLWPSLVETTSDSPTGCISLSGVSLKVGRPGAGNDIEMDDPLIAKHHAVIARRATGEWEIKALPSKNGVWVQIKTVRLSAVCRFQCGEQRFVFMT